MTAHRHRPFTPVSELGLVGVLLYGLPSSRTGRHGGVYVPPTDMYETEGEIVVQVEVAGVQQSDFSVSLFEHRLVIAGTRVDRGPVQRAYHQMEVHFGEFRSEVDLPVPVDEARVDAEYSDGFLKVVLPKLKPRVIDAQE